MAVFATALSTTLSPLPHVSFWGVEPGSDNYGLVNTAAYAVLFLAVAGHLRTEAQLVRLMGAVAISGVAVGGIAIAQHFGVLTAFHSDVFEGRAPATFGNPIVAGSFLVLLLPLVIGLATLVAKRRGGKAGFALGLTLAIVPLAGLVFVQSRGPWVGAVSGLIVFFCVLAFATRRYGLLKVSLGMTAVASLGILALSALPARGTGSSTTGEIGSYAASIYRETEGGSLSGRVDIWKDSASIAQERPWPDARAVPGLGDDDGAWVRSFAGYGPNLYPYVYPLKGSPESAGGVAHNAHSQLFTAWVELGFLGLLSLAALWGALVLAAWVLLRRIQRGRYSPVLSVAAVALVAACAGRFVEQLVWVPQVSDATLFWVLAGAFTALFAMTAPPQPARAATSPRPRPKAAPARAWPALAALAVTFALAAGLWQGNVNFLLGSMKAAEAQAAARDGEYTLAIERLRDASNLSPRTTSYEANRAAIYAALAAAAKDKESQTAALRRAYQEVRAGLASNPMDASLWSLAAQYAWNLARLDAAAVGDAVQTHAALKALLPASWQAANALAAVYLEFGHPEQSLQALSDSLKLTGTSRESAQALFLAGQAYLGVAKVSQGVQALEGSLRLDPSHPQALEAHRSLAKVYMERGDQAKASEHLAKVRAAVPVR